MASLHVRKLLKVAEVTENYSLPEITTVDENSK